MAKNKKLEVKGTEITILQHETDDYISLTDLARYKDSEHKDFTIFVRRCRISLLRK